MLLTTCATVMEKAKLQGDDEEACIMKAYDFLKGANITEADFEYAMAAVRSTAAKIFEKTNS